MVVSNSDQPCVENVRNTAVCGSSDVISCRHACSLSNCRLGVALVTLSTWRRRSSLAEYTCLPSTSRHHVTKLSQSGNSHSGDGQPNSSVQHRQQHDFSNLCRLQLYYTVSQKNIPDIFSYNSRKHWCIFILFGRNVTEKASNHVLLYFPPHLINASTLPCENEITKIVSFHINAACWFASRHTSHIGIIT